ncbi:MAG: hypothetical protein IT222_08590 [Crocinitomix sp.]|nr:hypothetical protein [Crocinitomix sp.]
MGKRIGVLGLVNYRTHPTNKNYTVFNFVTKEQADIFENELIQRKIWFEKDVEEHNNDLIYLFAVKQSDDGKAKLANYVVSGKTRNFMIKNVVFRYALVIFFIAIITLAVIGYNQR